MRVFAILLFLGVLITGCETGPQPVTKIADELRHTTSPYWSIATSDNTIHIKSKSEVTLLWPIQLPTGQSIEEDFKMFGIKTNYEIVLSFVPRMTDSELDAIKEKRRPYENVRTRDMAVASEVGEHLAKLPLPSFYTANYSIFIDPAPYGGGWLVSPPEAAQQVNDLTNCLMKTFREY